MKRPVLVLVAAVLLLSTVASGEPATRYLVATKGAARAGALHDLRTAGIEPAPRRVVEFETFAGFAADLTDAEAAVLRRSPAVRWIEPVVERHAFEIAGDALQVVPYGIDLVHAREAWEGRTAGVVNVAILDTGIDLQHAELKDFIAGGTNIVRPGGVDPMDDNGHGTHVAGTIAAADNDFGVVGVAPGVRLWAVKVLNGAGNGSSDGIIKALDWVVSQKKVLGGNWVVNLSLGSPQGSLAEREAFAKAADAGLIIAAASGNQSSSTTPAPVSFPAAYPGVIAVGAVDQSRRIADFSNQGPELDLSAPGVAVLSTVPTGSVLNASIADGLKLIDAQPINGSKVGAAIGQYVYCGLGRAEEIPASVAGHIALIRRGEIRFSEKARNAKEAGAIGVAIFNNTDDSIAGWTLLAADDPGASTYDWPVTVSLPREDGEALAAQTPHTLHIVLQADDYGVKSGTSMATPHVAAAAALLWTLAPNATSGSIINALVTTAIDRGATGPDPVYGAGIIDVNAAARLLAPEAFGETPAFTRPTTGRPIGKRGRG